MGLIAAALGSAGSVLYDQYKEYFYCDALSNETLAVKGKKKSSSWGSNYGNDNIITSGSLVTVADGQCMLIVDQGKIVDVCAEPGAYQYDASTEPLFFPAISATVYLKPSKFYANVLHSAERRRKIRGSTISIRKKSSGTSMEHRRRSRSGW